MLDLVKSVVFMFVACVIFGLVIVACSGALTLATYFLIPLMWPV